MAEPYFYAAVTVNGTANKEVLETILTSTEEEQKKVEEVSFVEITGAENNDAVLGAYIEREQVVEASIKNFLNVHDAAPSQYRNRVLELGHDLPVGQSLKVGHTSGGTASDFYYVVKYSIRG